MFDIDAIVSAAQSTFDEWVEDGYGICGKVAESIRHVLPRGLYSRAINHHIQPPHTTLWVSDGLVVWDIDVDWRAYERYDGEYWYKKEGAIITSADVKIRQFQYAPFARIAARVIQSVRVVNELADIAS